MTKEFEYATENGWKSSDKNEVFSYAESYMDYLNHSKTEREAVCEAVTIAKKSGFISIDEKKELAPGDKIYITHRGKNVLLAVIGQKPVSDGIRMVASHIDCPRLDLKQQPLHEEKELAFLRTHYYGGVKKYQWVTRPLALHGVVAFKDGRELPIAIGDEGQSYGFVITDLLPHFAREQMKKSMAEGVTGEALQLLCGSIPCEEEKESVKNNILALLNREYGITEADFLSAELSAVPAENARSIGFDQSLIGGYGQDDRVCSYAALHALLKLNNPTFTSVCLLIDKEEIGSAGLTGMRSRFFENALLSILEKTGVSELSAFMNTLFKSACLSGDVTAGVDPLYAEVHEAQNAAKIGHGIAVCKFTGAGGKSGASDADAKTMAAFRAMMDENNVCWQSCELGKIDAGGGGTISQYIAQLGMPTLDAGTPVLSMHAPYEITSKVDCYHTMLSYKAFYESCIDM